MTTKGGDLSANSSSTIPTATLLANGPSLNDVPTEMIERYPSFGVNRIYLREDVNPTYYSVYDQRMVKTDDLRGAAIAAAYRSERAFVKDDFGIEWPDNTLETPAMTPYDSKDPANARFIPAFSPDPRKVVVLGGTVIYANMQIAYWLGYRRLYLVGLDHEFFGPRGDHFAGDYNDGPDIAYTRDHQEYFRSLSDFYFEVAKIVFEAAGGEIINLTEGSKCDVFRFENMRDRL